MSKRIVIMASTDPPNNDVMTEILLLLPVQSLLRFRSVSKFWRDVIDSPSFRKSHTRKLANNNNYEDDTVYLRFNFKIDGDDRKLSIKFLDSEKSLRSYDDDDLNDLTAIPKSFMDAERTSVSFVGPVKGLICIIFRVSKPLMPMGAIAMCNPFLGQIKFLPMSPLLTASCSNSCRIFSHEIGIGFDDVMQDYKVVELLYCKEHRRVYAQVYSRRTNSWRELAGDGRVLDQELLITMPIKSSCKNGYFAHWLGLRLMGGNGDGDGDWEYIILTLDMKTESFRTITLPDCRYHSGRTNILAKDDGYSFLLFVLPKYGCFSKTSLVKIYESRCEGGKLSWNHVMDYVKPFCGIPNWRSDCVVLKNKSLENMVIFYDYCAREFAGCLELPAIWSWGSSEIVEYRGSLVSP